MNKNNPQNLNCLLCESKDILVCHSLSAEDILKCWATSAHHFSSAAVQPLLNEGTIRLYACQNCGFQFFNPQLAGNGAFYEQLHRQGSGYYAPDRPENKRNVGFAVQRGYRNILDVGCGSGFALDAAKLAGLETFGIELSRSAAVAATERGHTIFPVLLENMERTWDGKFDLISLNQVLEHVSDPLKLVQQCVRFLSPRGTIAIAVPSATGILRFDPWLPANWPPHHVSRWRRKDFDTLARKVGLSVTKVGGSPLLGAGIEAVLLDHRQHCQTLRKPYQGLSPSMTKLARFVYSKMGLKHIFKSQGHSIYCFLER